MKKEVGKKAKQSGVPVLAIIGVLLVSGGIASGLLARKAARVGTKAQPDVYHPHPKGKITFNKEIGPLIFNNCTICHRPGQSAPFAFSGYADVKKHLRDIVTVTQARYMPPWLPEPGHGDFVGNRRLTAEQLGMLKQWADEGAPEGNPADLLPLPQFASDWQLGPPDLVVTMPKSYQLRAEGPDVYRNFVVPAPITQKRFVKATEFRPGNSKIVHHVFIKLDRTSQSRALEGEDGQPGFSGLQAPAEIPDGLLLGWQPGRMPSPFPDGMAFRLEPGNDLVFQMHLNPSGKEEELQSSIGLYFTDRTPTKTCFRLELTAYTIDIPAGATNYMVEDSLTLPVDAQLIAILPHAHYLAKEMEGWAERPDGTRESLIWIKHWDFNWQTDYRYAQPVSLPKGTRLSMRYVYDNSTNNVRNPNHPPREVMYGSRSNDEMAELWFQLLPNSPADLALLNREREANARRRIVAKNEHLLQKNPDDSRALTEMGLILTSQQKLDEADRLLARAIKADPTYSLAHYNFGLLLRRTGRVTEARHEFEETLKLDPGNGKAHGNLGFILAEEGDPATAKTHFEEALRLNPFDQLARSALDELLAKLSQKPD